jgi:signal transduction histidine kinase
MQQRGFQLSDIDPSGRESSPSGSEKPLLFLSGSQLENHSAVGATQQDALEQLFKIHEYERCRMGQELHDSAGQLLVSLQLSVAHLRAVHNCDHDGLIDEIQHIVSQIDREIRSLAFLHYPVELGDRCLCSALQSLTLGFGRRTGIRTSFKCAGDRSPISEPISMAVLRVAQEALVNIHRHSHASSARIVFENRLNRIVLTVSDDGVGMPATEMQKMRGIGLQSMRHRIESIGGHFELKKLKHGTRVSARVPLAA